MPRPPLATIEDAKAALSLFNAKLERITGYSYFAARNLSFRSAWSADTNKTELFRDTPTDEQIDAVLLHLRFFFIGNENTTVYRIWEAYQILTPPAEIQARFDADRQRFNDWKEAPSGFDGKTNWVFLDIMIFAERAHRNDPHKIKVYDDWMRSPFAAEFSVFSLCRKMDEIVAHLIPIHAMNTQLLAIR